MASKKKAPAKKGFLEGLQERAGKFMKGANEKVGGGARKRRLDEVIRYNEGKGPKPAGYDAKRKGAGARRK
jgi:hypothetical protein